MKSTFLVGLVPHPRLVKQIKLELYLNFVRILQQILVLGVTPEVGQISWLSIIPALINGSGQSVQGRHQALELHTVFVLLVVLHMFLEGDILIQD